MSHENIDRVTQIDRTKWKLTLTAAKSNFASSSVSVTVTSCEYELT